MENFFATLQSALCFQMEKLSRKPWLDIKLYLMPRLRGYAWDVIPILELVSTSALISILLELFISRKLKIVASRYFVFLILVHLTLLAISRYLMHFNKLYHNLFFQTTCDTMEKNTSTTVQMAGCTKFWNTSHSLQCNKPEDHNRKNGRFRQFKASGY